MFTSFLFVKRRIYIYLFSSTGVCQYVFSIYFTFRDIRTCRFLFPYNVIRPLNINSSTQKVFIFNNVLILFTYAFRCWEMCGKLNNEFIFLLAGIAGEKRNVIFAHFVGPNSFICTPKSYLLALAWRMLKW